MTDALLFLGFLVVAVGVALTVVGTMISALRRRHRDEPRRTKTAGVVLIGPFPVIFGDKDLVKYSLVLLLIFVALSLILLLSFLRPA